MNHNATPDGPNNPAPPKAARSKGELLVAAFRAARILQRPALHTQRAEARTNLRAERLARLGTAPAPQATPLRQQAAAAAAAPHPAEQPAQSASIFAGYVDHASAQPEPMPEPAPDSTPEPAPAAAPHPASEAAPQTLPASDPEPAPPVAMECPAPPAPPAPSAPRALSSIGFGPGMTIRLSQVGIETISDLAQANPAALRHALGDISQLINVDVWIASAQAACQAPELADAK